MPQGKLKVKAKLPQTTKRKNATKNAKGPAVSKRKSCPIQQKKNKIDEKCRLKKIVSKSVNKAVEEEIRSRAEPAKKILSKAEQAVVKHS